MTQDDGFWPQTILYPTPAGLATFDELPDLIQADIYINHKEPIPLDLAARLMEQGFDVNTMEGF